MTSSFCLDPSLPLGGGLTFAAEGPLPLQLTFRGQGRFAALIRAANLGNWRALPLGDRTVRVGLSLLGTPYRGFTLEIHDRVESPSANLEGLDCWTFYEISLGFARMLRMKTGGYTPEDLLKAIELERYHDGRCTGNYLSRFHFLEQLFADNERRGLLQDLTRHCDGAERIPHRTVREMSVMSSYYRYLRNNPELRAGMAQIEAEDSDLPVFHLPKERARGAEATLQNGDVIAVTSRDEGGYTSHVGLACRDQRGTLRFLHASSREGRVVLGEELSVYLNKHSDDLGVILVRPRELPGATLANSPADHQDTSR